jgi:hypothetical protein
MILAGVNIGKVSLFFIPEMECGSMFNKVMNQNGQFEITAVGLLFFV